MKKSASTSCRASALLLVLWALLLLSAAVFSWTVRVQDGLAEHGGAARASEARAMAQSGLAVALHPGVSRRTPLPETTLGSDQIFRVRLTGEGGKLNLHWLLRGEEPRKLAMLKQWLERRGLDFEQREAFIDGVLDYMDADSLKRLNGGEEAGGYRPANRELRALPELARVPSAAPLVAQTGWADELTILSLGPIDLTAASPEILGLLPGLGETRLREFVKFRRGADGLDDTPDDPGFANLDVIRQLLGLSTAQFEELRALTTSEDPTMRIRSEGRSAQVTRAIEVVVRKNAGKPQILSWNE